MHALQTEIERLASSNQLGANAREVFLNFRDALTRGEIQDHRTSRPAAGGQSPVNYPEQAVAMQARPALGQRDITGE